MDTSLIQLVLLDAVALVFVVSGFAKLRDVKRFRKSLLFLPYMRVSWSYGIGYGLPIVELLVGIGIYLNLSAAKLAAVVLLLMFCAVTALVLARGLEISCNCFGPAMHRRFSQSVVWQNAVLIGILILTFPLRERAVWVLPLLAAASAILLTLLVAAIAGNIRTMGRFVPRG